MIAMPPAMTKQRDLAELCGRALVDEDAFAALYESKIDPVPGCLSRQEAYFLFKAAAKISRGCIVEIGSYRGRSATALSLGTLAGKQVPIFAIDPHEYFRGSGGGEYGPDDRAAFYQAALASGSFEFVRLVNLSSEIITPGWTEPVALLWIDGDHTYSAVRRDITLWQPHLTSDALIIFDDVSPSFEGPRRIVEEMIESGWEVIHRQLGNTASLRQAKSAVLPWQNDIHASDRAWVSPNTLLLAHRFDLGAKVRYARNYLAANHSAWLQDLYLRHIEVWNGFFEEYPPKRSSEDYLDTFHRLTDDVKAASGRGLNSAIPLSRDGSPVNGAHRLSAALACGREVPIVRTDIHSVHSNYDFAFFRQRFAQVEDGEDYCDAMALGMLDIIPHSSIAIRFAVDHGQEVQVAEKLSEHADIVYQRRIKLSPEGQVNLILELYDGESWCGTAENNYAGARGKAHSCFQESATADVYLLAHRSNTDTAIAKEAVRALFSRGKHSIHITDTTEEARRIGRALFSRTGIDFINQRSLERPMPRFDALFQSYRAAVEQTGRPDAFCIDGSAVMSALGLRDCADLDYLHAAGPLPTLPDINTHNDHAHYYSVSINELLLDHRKHFFFRGIRFVAVAMLHNWKAARAETKDLADLRMLDELTSNATADATLSLDRQQVRTESVLNSLPVLLVHGAHAHQVKLAAEIILLHPASDAVRGPLIAPGPHGLETLHVITDPAALTVDVDLSGLFRGLPTLPLVQPALLELGREKELVRRIGERSRLRVLVIADDLPEDDPWLRLRDEIGPEQMVVQAWKDVTAYPEYFVNGMAGFTWLPKNATWCEAALMRLRGHSPA